MPDCSFSTIDQFGLQEKLDRVSPNNEDPRVGYALVNVLDPEGFDRARIPGSTNIPHGEEDEFQERFDKQKEIIVYCASPECDASRRTARALANRGFEHVIDYEAGLRVWRLGGRMLTGSAL